MVALLHADYNKKIGLIGGDRKKVPSTMLQYFPVSRERHISLHLSGFQIAYAPRLAAATTTPEAGLQPLPHEGGLQTGAEVCSHECGRFISFRV